MNTGSPVHCGQGQDVELICGDILEPAVQLKVCHAVEMAREQRPSARCKAVANVPYYITTGDMPCLPY